MSYGVECWLDKKKWVEKVNIAKKKIQIRNEDIWDKIRVISAKDKLRLENTNDLNI